MNAMILSPRRYRSLLVVLCLLLAGTITSRWMPQPVPLARAAEKGDLGELDALLKARYQTANRLLNMEDQRLQKNVTTLGRVCEVARWVRDSAVELPGTSADRLKALTNYVALTRRLEASMNRAASIGAAASNDVETARYLRLDAEVTLLRAQQTQSH